MRRYLTNEAQFPSDVASLSFAVLDQMPEVEGGNMSRVLSEPILRRAKSGCRQHAVFLAGLYFHMAVGRTGLKTYRLGAIDSIPEGRILLAPADKLDLVKHCYGMQRRSIGLDP